MPPSHLPEHKIAVFVRFCPPEPPFSDIRAQNLGFCARKVAKMLGKRWMGHREEVDGASGITKMTFVKLIVHSNTHCYLRCPDHSPVPGAGRTTKKDDQYLLVVLFCLACVLSVFTLQAAICSVLERRSRPLPALRYPCPAHQYKKSAALVCLCHRISCQTQITVVEEAD